LRGHCRVSQCHHGGPREWRVSKLRGDVTYYFTNHNTNHLSNYHDADYNPYVDRNNESDDYSYDHHDSDDEPIHHTNNHCHQLGHYKPNVESYDINQLDSEHYTYQHRDYISNH
jgi:hypothetical protein